LSLLAAGIFFVCNIQKVFLAKQKFLLTFGLGGGVYFFILQQKGSKKSMKKKASLIAGLLIPAAMVVQLVACMPTPVQEKFECLDSKAQQEMINEAMARIGALENKLGMAVAVDGLTDEQRKQVAAMVEDIMQKNSEQGRVDEIVATAKTTTATTPKTTEATPPKTTPSVEGQEQFYEVNQWSKPKQATVSIAGTSIRGNVFGAMGNWYFIPNESGTSQPKVYAMREEGRIFPSEGNGDKKFTDTLFMVLGWPVDGRETPGMGPGNMDVDAFLEKFLAAQRNTSTERIN
jgi:hypothetical protein